nr:hypothetical protein [Mucilaginibacter sp. SP1R1]
MFSIVIYNIGNKYGNLLKTCFFDIFQKKAHFFFNKNAGASKNE